MTNRSKHLARTPLGPDKRKPGRDVNPLLNPRQLLGTAGKPGTLEEMTQTHMRIAARVFDTQALVSSQDWVVSPPTEPSLEEESFSNLCGTLCSDMRRDYENDNGNLGDSLGVAQSSTWFGHWAAEMSLYTDPTSALGARLEVYDIHQSTIEAWDWEGSKLVGIKQRTMQDGAYIPIEDLAIICVGDPWPTGAPRLRPAVFWFEIGKAVAISFSEQASAASGVLVVELDGATSQEQMDNSLELIVDFQTEDGRPGVIVGGRTGVKSAEIKHPGAMMDPTIYLNYFDGQVDQLMQSSLQSLGLTAGSGSRALGEELAVADEEKWEASLATLGKRWGDQVFRWIARRATGPNGGPYTGRLPRLHVDEGEVDQGTTGKEAPLWGYEGLGVIKGLIDIGILPLSPELREYAAASVGGLPQSLIDTLDLSSTPIEGGGAVGSDATDPAQEASLEAQKQAITLAAHAPSCGCGGHMKLAAAKPVGPFRLTDAYGKEYTSSIPLEDHSPDELRMQFGAQEDARLALDAQLATQLDAVTAKARVDISKAILAVAPGANTRKDPDVIAVIEGAEEAYQSALDEYTDKAREMTHGLGATERDAVTAPVQTDLTSAQVGDITDSLTTWINEEETKIQNQSQGAASRMAARVTSDMIDASDLDMQSIRDFEASGPLAYEPRVSSKAIASEASAPISAAENLGRVTEARDQQRTDPRGRVVTALTRTVIRDGKACAHCLGLSGVTNPEEGRMEFPRDLEKYKTSPDFIFPDPRCAGKDKCRCYAVITWGMPAT